MTTKIDKLIPGTLYRINSYSYTSRGNTDYGEFLRIEEVEPRRHSWKSVPTRRVAVFRLKGQWLDGRWSSFSRRHYLHNKEVTLASRFFDPTPFDPDAANVVADKHIAAAQEAQAQAEDEARSLLPIVRRALAVDPPYGITKLLSFRGYTPDLDHLDDVGTVAKLAGSHDAREMFKFLSRLIEEGSGP